MKTATVTVTAGIIRANRQTHPTHNGWMGTLKGIEEVGSEIEFRRQIDADRYEYRPATILEVESHVTGDIEVKLDVTQLA